MSNVVRLPLIKASKHFTKCKCCGFEYMPFSLVTIENCPKCEPEMLYVEDFSNEVNYDNLTDDFFYDDIDCYLPKFKGM